LRNLHGVLPRVVAVARPGAPINRNVTDHAMALPIASARLRSRAGMARFTPAQRKYTTKSASTRSVRVVTTVIGSLPPTSANPVQMPTIARDVAKTRT